MKTLHWVLHVLYCINPPPNKPIVRRDHHDLKDENIHQGVDNDDIKMRIFTRVCVVIPTYTQNPKNSSSPCHGNPPTQERQMSCITSLASLIPPKFQKRKKEGETGEEGRKGRRKEKEGEKEEGRRERKNEGRKGEDRKGSLSSICHQSLKLHQDK